MRLQTPQGTSGHFSDVYRGLVEGSHTALDARELPQFLHHLRQLIQFDEHLLKEASGDRRVLQSALLQGFGQGRYGSYRRTEFVGDIGDKIPADYLRLPLRRNIPQHHKTVRLALQRRHRHSKVFPQRPGFHQSSLFFSSALTLLKQHVDFMISHDLNQRAPQHLLSRKIKEILRGFIGQRDLPFIAHHKKGVPYMRQQNAHSISLSGDLPQHVLDSSRHLIEGAPQFLHLIPAGRGLDLLIEVTFGHSLGGLRQSPDRLNGDTGDLDREKQCDGYDDCSPKRQRSIDIVEGFIDIGEGYGEARHPNHLIVHHEGNRNVQHVIAQGLAISGTRAHPLQNSLLDLRPVGMILHSARILLGVAQDRPLKIDECDAGLDVLSGLFYQLVEVLGLACFKRGNAAIADQTGLMRELYFQLIGIVVLEVLRQIEAKPSNTHQDEQDKGYCDTPPDATKHSYSSNLYPNPRTVIRCWGLAGSVSIFCLSHRIWTSTVRVSPSKS